MFTLNQIATRPNPFVHSITLEITATEDRSGVVRMVDTTGKIISLFLWNMKKGVNISNISNLNKLNSGAYLLDVLDEKGHILCSTKVVK